MQRPYLAILFICLLGLFSTGCEKAADLDNRKHYNKQGISFVYPGNWRVESDDVDATGFRTILIETPGDAIAIVQQFEAKPDTDLQAYAELFSQMTKAEIPVGELSESTYKPYIYNVKHSETKLSGVQENFAITLVGERVPHVRAYFGFDKNFPNTVMICQVATEDLKKVRPGCDLILDHLKVDEKP